MAENKENIQEGIETPEQEHVIVPVCYLCDGTEVVGKCIHCSKPFCARDTNRIDPRYCAECMSDIVIEETTFTKKSEEYDEDTDTVHHTTQSCRDILFRGIDWMFACKRLSSMTDTEAKTELEYHRAMVHFLESDLLSRSVKSYRMKVQSDIDKKHEKRAASIQKLTETKTRKVVKVSKDFDAVKFAQVLLQMGITNLNTQEKTK